MNPTFGRLHPRPVSQHPELVAEPVRHALASGSPAGVLVAAIDPAFADTEALCAEYGVPLGDSANAVVVRGVRAGVEKYVVCMTPATHRVDVNGLVRRRLDVRKASFAPMDVAVAATGMEYGGITPIGVPSEWPIWVDGAVADADWVCIGSGLRGSKVFLPGPALLELPGAARVDGLARPVL